MDFQVCLFVDGVQAIPLNWIEGKVCQYPNYMNQIRINKAISSEEEPASDWIRHTIIRTFGHPTGFEMQVIKKLQTLIHKVRGLEAKLDQIIDSKKDDGGCNLIEDAVDLFPIKTKNEMEDFEENCKEPHFIKKCVTGLKSLGGSVAVEIVVRIMEAVLTNEMAEQYSLYGRKDKDCFKKLALYKVIFNTVRVHMTSTTQKEVDQIVARWLVQAKVRRARIANKATSDSMPEMNEENNNNN